MYFLFVSNPPFQRIWTLHKYAENRQIIEDYLAGLTLIDAVTGDKTMIRILKIDDPRLAREFLLVAQAYTESSIFNEILDNRCSVQEFIERYE